MQPGLENGFEKNLGFLGLKNPKTSKVQNLGFLVKFYTNHIKFHILIVICVFRLFYKNVLKESELCIGCSSWVEIFCPVLFAVA